MSINDAQCKHDARLTLPACLIIMDGFGIAEAGPGNAISLQHPPA